jgi:hypothetical protein
MFYCLQRNHGVYNGCQTSQVSSTPGAEVFICPQASSIFNFEGIRDLDQTLKNAILKSQDMV